ncbi:aminoglycoside phosphotransferase family protein [bacterium]|nr:aminoglycoside phosphotransferase family protein [bacterium]
MIVEEISKQFSIQGSPVKIRIFGSGHIHDTYHILTDAGQQVLLQKINDRVFQDVPVLMSNIKRVTRHLYGKMLRMPDHDPERETMILIPTVNGKHYLYEKSSGYWRMYRFITESRYLDQVEDPRMVEQAGLAYGRFLAWLVDLPGPRLHETIPAFHDMGSRIGRFLMSAQKDPAGRVRLVRKEITWIEKRTDEMMRLHFLRVGGRIPERITHNDTKINNVLFDTKGIALCVSDLDTVMPGIVHYDFGDAVRTAASTAMEDEKDLRRVSVDLRLFEAFSKGYLHETASILNAQEIEKLAFSARMMTFLIGLRFLTDFLEGDLYYKIHYPDQNLQRARVQFRLVESMEKNADSMEEIISRIIQNQKKEKMK